MTPNEAHDYTIDVVKELKEAGIEVEITPYKYLNTSHGQNMIQKYGSQPDRASPNKWCRAKFTPESSENKKLLRQKQRELGWMGILFDSGGGFGTRDWELDWSFRYTEKPASPEREQMVENTNDMIDEIEKGNPPQPPTP